MAGMGLTIVILVISGIFSIAVIFFVFRMIKGSMGDQATLQSGVPGTATVVSLEPTGTVITDMYYVCRIGLRVQLPAQAPFDVIVKQSVPITAMARVNPGQTIGVKVDPTDNTKVVVDWSAPVQMPSMGAPQGVVDPSAAQMAAGIAAAAASGGIGQSGIQVTSTRDLLQKGQRVLGVLTEFADTGNTPRSLNIAPSKPEFIDDPMYAVTLQLHIPNMAPIESKVVQRVPRAMVPQLHLGLQLNCAVDPANPTREVAIDWGDIT
jgi:hypothetical protein